MIWEKGMEIVSCCYKLTAKLPDSERYGLVSQINRSAVSIPSNIAEGASRDSSKDFNYFLRIALGSSFELETQLLILSQEYLTSDKSLDSTLLMIDEEQKMIMALMKKL